MIQPEKLLYLSCCWNTQLPLAYFNMSWVKEKHVNSFLFFFLLCVSSLLLCSSPQEDAFAFATRVGYPCLLRPSYVLRWGSMRCRNNLKEWKAAFLKWFIFFVALKWIKKCMQSRAQRCLSLMLHVPPSSKTTATPPSLILLKLLHTQLPRHLTTCTAWSG